jgi:biotin synthase
MVRTIATACIIMPSSRVRLSAGRTQMSEEAQTLCFLAGASSIFTGDKLLTTPNPGEDQDRLLLRKLGLKPVEADRVDAVADACATTEDRSCQVAH